MPFGGTFSAPLLLLIAAGNGFTWPLSTSGLRSLLPLIVPRPLWERANAIDSNGYVIATLIGPPAAGALVASPAARWPSRWSARSLPPRRS